MEEYLNPYAPGAGTPPPALVGRSQLLDQVETALQRILAGRSAKSIVPIGLRGVGKTVLLRRFVRMAEELGYRTIFMEASEDGSFASALARYLREPLSVLSERGISGKMRRALRVFRSFSLGIDTDGRLSFSLKVEPEPGVGDSGQLDIDLSDLFEAIGGAAKEKQSGIFIAIDEIQYLTRVELGALIAAQHRTMQLQLPILVSGSGLPQLPALAGEAKSYAERLFEFPTIGPLSREDVTLAIEGPANILGVGFTAEATDEISKITEGYPYFVQEWAYDTWNCAERSPICLDDVHRATPTVKKRLAEHFFNIRVERLTLNEQKYLHAMATLGPGSHASGKIAEVVGKGVKTLAPIREKLIRKGMIYSPGFGETAFTVPLFDRYLLETLPA